jgi:hypothetical protein
MHVALPGCLLLLLQGEALVIPKAVCLHEEDAGMLWKHTDTRLGHVEVRRNRRLVISMVSTFANYVSAAAVLLCIGSVCDRHMCRVGCCFGYCGQGYAMLWSSAWSQASATS